MIIQAGQLSDFYYLRAIGTTGFYMLKIFWDDVIDIIFRPLLSLPIHKCIFFMRSKAILPKVSFPQIHQNFFSSRESPLWRDMCFHCINPFCLLARVTQ